MLANAHSIPDLSTALSCVINTAEGPHSDLVHSSDFQGWLQPLQSKSKGMELLGADSVDSSVSDQPWAVWVERGAYTTAVFAKGSAHTPCYENNERFFSTDYI